MSYRKVVVTRGISTSWRTLSRVQHGNAGVRGHTDRRISEKSMTQRMAFPTRVTLYV